MSLDFAALVRYNQRLAKVATGDLPPFSGDTNHAIDFLEHCVDTQPHLDKAIHNYLVLLHAQRPDDRELLRFLEKYAPAFGGAEGDTYDLEYALRVCTQHEQVLN